MPPHRSSLDTWLDDSGMKLLSEAGAVARTMAQHRFRGPQILLGAFSLGHLDELLLRSSVESGEAEEMFAAAAKRASTSWSSTEDEPTLDSSLEQALLALARRGGRPLAVADILECILIDGAGMSSRDFLALRFPWDVVKAQWESLRIEERSAERLDVASSPFLHTAIAPVVCGDALTRFGKAAARNDNSDEEPLYHVELACRRLAATLGRLTRCSAMIVGDVGVGKSSVVKAFARWLTGDDAPDYLRGLKIASISGHTLAAGSGYRGELEERLQQVIDAGLTQKSTLLFLDEIDVLAEASAAAGKSLLGLFNEHLEVGTLRLIAAASTTGFEKYLRKHDAFLRRFELIRLTEPNPAEVKEILRLHVPAFRQHYGFGADDQVLDVVIRNCERYMPSHRFPAKALAVLDSALQRHRDDCRGSTAGAGSLPSDVVLSVISDETGIPVARLGEMEAARLAGLEEYLAGRVLDQKVATKMVAESLQELRLGLKDSKRTGGAFLFVGPPGTGKTELAKVLAEYLMGSERALVRFNMSEFQTPESYQRLVGSPPGYVGFEAGGELTNRLMDNPYSIVLFDEIEKGSSRVFDVFLQVLSDGHLMDSHGRTVDCKNSVFFMTSNALSTAEGMSDAQIREFLLDYHDPHARVGSGPTFRREFIDRLHIVPFGPLMPGTLSRITEREVHKILEQVNNGEIIDCHINASSASIEWIVGQIDVETTGARAVQRLVESHVSRLISSSFLQGNLEKGGCYLLDLDPVGGLRLHSVANSEEGEQ